MSPKVIILILTTVLSAGLSHAQELGSWESYSSFRPVRLVDSGTDATLWVATEGGLYSVVDGKTDGIYTRKEGLYQLNPSAMAYHAATGLLWIGYEDGMIESFDPKTELFQREDAVFRAAQYSRRSINSIRVTSDRLYVATSFGVVVYDPARRIVIDTYANLGTFASGTNVNDVALAGSTIYAATDIGLAIGDPSRGDLVNPSNWRNTVQQDALQSRIVRSVAWFRDRLYASIGQSNFVYQNGSWQALDVFSSGPVLRFRPSKSQSRLLAIGIDAAKWIGSDGIVQSVSLPSGVTLRDMYLNDNAGEEIFLGTAASGLLRLANRNDSQPTSLTPSGPYLNLFNGMKVIDGVLISGTSASPGRFSSNFINTGYVLRKDGEWINRNRDTNADMLTYNANSYYVSAGTPNHYFFGSWGDGIAMHVVETNQTVVLNNEAGATINPTAPPTFTVVPGMDVDTNGKLWFPVFLGNPNALYQFDPVTRQFRGFPRYQLVSVSEHYFGLLVDSASQKWIPIVDASQNGRGLLVLDQGNLDNGTDDQGVLLTQSSNNLSNNKIQAMLQDRRGEVWVGTAEGIARFLFPDRVIRGNAADRQAERLRIRNQLTGDITFFLNRTSITSLAVNSANEKWIGTQGDGVYHVREDGGLITIIKHFTSNNSPLPSNNVISVAVDDRSGIVYIATDVGLLSYADAVTVGVDDMKTLQVYPNPYVYDRSVGTITIEGLSEETQIHVVTVDGKMIQRLDARGGRTTWDGLDQFGNRLATGVYTIIAVQANGSQKGIGKVAIVR